MSIILAGSAESLQVVLGAAPATNQIPLSASWADQGGAASGNSINSNGATAVTLVSAPSGSTGRVISDVQIVNTDTAPVTVTINHVRSGGTYLRLRVLLAVNYQLIFGGGQWRVIDASGVLQQSGSGGGGGTWGSISGTLSAQTDLASALAGKDTLGVLAGINSQTGTSYSLVLTDPGKDVQITNSAAIAVSIPLNASVPFAIGTMIILRQGGAGAITITGVTGVTVDAPNANATTGLKDARVLEKIGTDEWVIW